MRGARYLLYAALVPLTLILVSGCQHTPPASSAGAIPPPALADDLLVSEARSYVAHLAGILPAWDADYLGQFERAEIAAVRADINNCNTASTDEDFMAFAQRLMEDAAALRALDEKLAKDSVI